MNHAPSAYQTDALPNELVIGGRTPQVRTECLPGFNGAQIPICLSAMVLEAGIDPAEAGSKDQPACQQTTPDWLRELESNQRRRGSEPRWPANRPSRTGAKTRNRTEDHLLTKQERCHCAIEAREPSSRFELDTSALRVRRTSQCACKAGPSHRVELCLRRYKGPAGPAS